MKAKTKPKAKPAAKKPKETPREKYNRENLEQLPELFAPAHALTDEKLGAALVCAQGGIDHALASLKKSMLRMLEVEHEQARRSAPKPKIDPIAYKLSSDYFRSVKGNTAKRSAPK